MSEISLGSNLGKNLIINPTMDLSQRDLSFVAVASDDYTLDRFVYTKVGTMVHDIDREANNPSSFGVYCLKSNVTTAQASITAPDFVKLEQRIEGFNARSIMGRDILLAFDVYATKTGIYCASFGNENSDRSIVKEYTVNASNTWERKVIRIKHDETGVWDKLDGIGLRAIWTIAAGTNFQTTEGTWTSGEYYATTNQVNGVDAINNEFKITNIQLHEGITEIPFRELVRPKHQEIKLAEWYFRKSWVLDTPVKTATNNGVNNSESSVTSNEGQTIRYPRMRSTGTVLVYDHLGVGPGVVTRNGSSGQAVTAIDRISDNSFNIFMSSAQDLAFHFTIDCEL